MTGCNFLKPGMTCLTRIPAKLSRWQHVMARPHLQTAHNESFYRGMSGCERFVWVKLHFPKRNAPCTPPGCADSIETPLTGHERNVNSVLHPQIGLHLIIFK